MSVASSFLEKLKQERLDSYWKSQKIIADCDRRMKELEETMTIKEYAALQRAKEYEAEKLIYIHAIGNTEENKEVN